MPELDLQIDSNDAWAIYIGSRWLASWRGKREREQGKFTIKKTESVI